jgi:hypothetical protein
MRNRLTEFHESIDRIQARWAKLTLREPRAKYRAWQDGRQEYRQERKLRRDERAVSRQEKELRRRKREIRDQERELRRQRQQRFKRILGGDDDE